MKNPYNIMAQQYFKNKLLILALLFTFSILINLVFSSIFMKGPSDFVKGYLEACRSGFSVGHIMSDELQYQLLANSIVSGHGFSLPNPSSNPEPSMIREPVYPLFLSLIYILFGHSFKLVFFTQKLLLGAIVVLVYLIVVNILQHNHKHTIGLIIAMLIAINIDLNYFSNLLMSEILFIFLWMLFAYFFVKAIKHSKIIFYELSGLVLGLSTLCKSLMSLYFVFSLFLIIYFSKRVKIIYLLVFLFCYFSLVTPWIIRNYVLFNHPSITTRGGSSLWFRAKKLDYQNLDELNKRAVYIFSKEIGKMIYPEYKEPYKYIFSRESLESQSYYDKLRNNLSDAEIDKLYLKEALAKIKQRPVKYFLMGIYEIANLNSFCLNSIVSSVLEERGLGSFAKFLRIIYKLFFLISIPLFFIGLSWIKKYRLLLIPFSTIIYFNFFYSLVSIDRSGFRYILPVVPYYLTFILLGADSFLNYFKHDKPIYSE